MRVKKNILIIDDEEQKQAIEYMIEHTKDIVDLECVQINVLKSMFDERKGELSPEKLYSEIESQMSQKHFDLILTDNGYGREATITGLDVIGKIRENRKNVDIILYSAVQKEIISQVVGDNTGDEQAIINGINKLMSYKIIKMSSRDGYRDDTISYLKSKNDPSPTSMLSQMLRENGDRIFQSCYPKFKGKSFRQIADIIDQTDNMSSNDWLKAVFEQLISYLTIANED